MRMMRRWVLRGMLGVLFLAACANEQDAPPGDAVIAYLNALLSGDEAALVNGVCADWEADALRDLDAFTGVTGELADAACTTAGTEGQFTLITCTGEMVLDYRGEVRTRSLEGQTYRVSQENGEWKMCGYQ